MPYAPAKTAAIPRDLASDATKLAVDETVRDDLQVSAARQFPRYAIAAEVELLHEGVTVTGRTRNLSRGGLCAVTRGALRAGVDVQARIALLFRGGAVSEPLLIPMRIVWCTALGQEFQIGCSFVAVSGEQRQYLDVFIKYLAEGGEAKAAESEGPEPATEQEDPFTD